MLIFESNKATYCSGRVFKKKSLHHSCVFFFFSFLAMLLYDFQSLKLLLGTGMVEDIKQSSGKKKSCMKMLLAY